MLQVAMTLTAVTGQITDSLNQNHEWPSPACTDLLSGSHSGWQGMTVTVTNTKHDDASGILAISDWPCL